VVSATDPNDHILVFLDWAIDVAMQLNIIKFYVSVVSYVKLSSVKGFACSGMGLGNCMCLQGNNFFSSFIVSCLYCFLSCECTLALRTLLVSEACDYVFGRRDTIRGASCVLTLFEL
jgi:hypothetical protein